MFTTPSLSLVPPEHRQAPRRHAIQALAPGETLVAEAEPSRSLFVVKSGVVAVVHERPERRFVRCCSPGALLGESSVLVDSRPSLHGHPADRPPHRSVADRRGGACAR